DRQRIVFGAQRPDTKTTLYAVKADGTGAPEELFEPEFLPLALRPESVSPDGKILAFSRFSVGSKFDIWIVPFTGDRKPQLFLGTPFNESGVAFSPDGRWIAYMSDESGGSTGG